MEIAEADEEARRITAFCEGLYPQLVAALSLQCGDRSVAEDLAQEALARTWQRWASVSRMERPEAWTFRVAINLASSRGRRLGAEMRARARSYEGDRPGEPDVADRLALRSALQRLPNRQRAALVLRFFVGLSVNETAAALGCTAGTVKSHCHRGIRALRVQFDIEETQDEDVVEHA